ncbi:MAG: hypothetical protein CMQ15_14405 [Gammaproteobacteria bacterium]|nr:hypothetical protein [Gammaproteobacteria bacterium]HJN96916.1 hypothetical protein [Gammaproteobacteria bacterium]|tara:strand:- start:3894 stop:4334 length:441 start_codon:yes stop_codon:yes gene_type:complete
MLGKILLTLAVIGIAYFILRKRQIAESGNQQPPARKSPTADKSAAAGKTASAVDQKEADGSLAADLRIGAYMFLVLMVGLGAALYYFRWQDDHRILTVNLHRDSQATPVTYEVYKYQLDQRSFVTVDGTTVNVAGDERMEVIGLQD